MFYFPMAEEFFITSLNDTLYESIKSVYNYVKVFMINSIVEEI